MILKKKHLPTLPSPVFTTGPVSGLAFKLGLVAIPGLIEDGFWSTFGFSVMGILVGPTTKQNFYNTFTVDILI